MENKKIAVLIPCYNEEKTIVKVIKDFKKQLPSATIYVYDNNSLDCSYELSKKQKCIVRKVINKGKGNVVRQMFSDIDADCYLMVDADDTYSPKIAKEMCNYILYDGYDMVIGDRLSTTYYQENKKITHNYGNKLVCFLINKLFKYKINDVMSGYRAFSKKFVKNMPIISNNFEIETEITIYAIINHYYIKTIPVLYKDRIRGSISKINTILDGVSIIKTIIKLYIEEHPKKIYTYLSIITFICFLYLYLKKNNISIVFLFLTIITYSIGIILSNIKTKYKRLLEIEKMKK